MADRTPAEIAAGLSEAQRRMLLHLPLLVATCDWRTFPSLKRRGLLANSTLRSGMSILVLTDAGEAVRAQLLGEG